jgi:DNA mismatch repair ATPase MutS
MMEYSLLQAENDHLTFLSMRCQVQNEVEEEEAESIPLYEIEVGRAVASRALQCAMSSGVRLSVVKRAKSILNVRHGKNSLHALVPDSGEIFVSNKRLVEYFLMQDQWSDVKTDLLQNLSVCAIIRP